MSSSFESADQAARLWTDLAAKMMSAWTPNGAQASDAVPPPPPEFARRIRDASLSALGEQADKYMRSPQFLEQVKQSLDASVAFRKQLNEWFTDAHHSVQGVARQDIDALFQSLRHMEHRVLDRLEAIQSELDDFRRRVEAFESAGRRSPAAGAASGDDAKSEPGRE